MGKRYLEWHVPQIRGDNDAQGGVYYADQDYAPSSIRIYARNAPIAGDLQVDIRDDGTSILTSNYARLVKGDNLEEDADDYPNTVPTIEEGSVVTLHIISSGGAEDITCTLELTNMEDDEGVG